MTLFWEHGDLFIRDLVALLPEPRPSESRWRTPSVTT